MSDARSAAAWLVHMHVQKSRTAKGANAQQVTAMLPTKLEAPRKLSDMTVIRLV